MFLLIGLAWLIASCSDSAAESSPTPTPVAIERSIRAVTATARTEILDSEHNLDEPVLWVSEESPGDSMIIVTDKAYGDTEIGGLRTYGLDGTLLQTLSGFYPNNVDLISEFPLGGDQIDLVTTIDRTEDHFRILFFRVDSNPQSPTYRDLINVSGRNLDLDFPPYGQALFHDSRSDRWYVFVTQGVEPFHILQYEITEGTGIDSRRVVLADPDPVRTIAYRPSVDGVERVPLTLSEGLRVDPVHDALYVGEEDFGLLRYGAGPLDGTAGSIVDEVATQGGNVLPEVEGITVIALGETDGFVIVSGQNDGEIARYEVYDRESNEHLHSFVIAPSTSGLPSANGTDGIYGYFGYLDEAFPNGIFIVHTDNSEEGNPSLLLVRLEDIWPEGLAGSDAELGSHEP